MSWPSLRRGAITLDRPQRKYRAIVRAEQLATRQVPNEDAVLICSRPRRKITKALIKRLNVNIHWVPLDAEQ